MPNLDPGSAVHPCSSRHHSSRHQKSISQAARHGAIGALASLLVISCGGPTDSTSEPAAVRLVDHFDDQWIENPHTVEETAPIAAWTFETLGDWRAASGVSNLQASEGRLRGTSSNDFPVLHVERVPQADDQDLLHAVEIRARADAGTELAVEILSDEKLEIQRVLAMAQQLPWQTKSPLIPAEDDVRTYVLPSFFPIRASQARHILIRPTDAAGVNFEVESVRLVFRREHLASIPTGIGWHGLSETYRETVIARAPERIRWPVTLGQHAWLDLSVGTVEDLPVTFRVSIAEPGSDAKTLVAERTVTQPDLWESLRLDLDAHAGQSIDLLLELDAGNDGALGFWGAPAVRRKVSKPATATADAVTPPRNVILILADTLRPDHLDLFGYDRTTAPGIRDLAKRGTAFRNTVAQGTWTKVSVTSLMSSLYVGTHGVTDLTDRLPSQAPTLAEQFRDAGYATLSLTAISFAGRMSNLHQGFETLHEGGLRHASSKNTRQHLDRLLPWLEQHHDVPFFVFLHLFDPHNPYEPQAPYNALWNDPDTLQEHRDHLEVVRPHIEDTGLRFTGMPNRAELETAGLSPDLYIERETGWYDSSIRAMDAELGRLFERLHELGVDDHTLIVFTSDHGEEMLEHDRMFHGQSVYSELTQVPLILSLPPAVASGRVVDETVQLIDVMPTLLELCGLPAPETLQGRSLVPLLQPGESTTRWKPRPAFSEKPATQHMASPPPRDRSSTTILYEGWKLIYNEERPEDVPEHELYRLADDPLDQTNLASEHPEVVERLRGYLDDWRKTIEKQRLTSDEDPAESMSPEELERLRALGYL